MEKHPEAKNADVSAFPDPHLKHIFFLPLSGVSQQQRRLAALEMPLNEVWS